MILLGSKIIISYIPYEYKPGGFCLVCNPGNEIGFEEVTLDENQISELKNPIKYKTNPKTYRELLDIYFDSQIPVL